MRDPTQTVQSKFANSPAILQLVENFDQYFSPSANIEQFFNLVWNINTAIGYGLIIWGEIVNVGNVVTIPAYDTFGFNQGGSSYTGFGQGPFSGGASSTENVALSDSAYQQVILAKALFNICNGSTQAINQILLNLFPGRGNCYVNEVSPLVIEYVFDFALTAVEYATITQLNILPRPCGVATSVVVPS